MPSPLDHVRVVLYEPQKPINIAGTVRAMKNMGVGELRLVRPCAYDANYIEVIAHHTRDIADRIRHFDTLDAALADCVRVAAFTGRRRAAKWPITTPRAAAADLAAHAEHGPVAVLFGREDDGLPADAIDRAGLAVTIPTTAHASLNVAQAVLVALYELHLAAEDATVPLGRSRKHAPPPTAAEFEEFFADTERALSALDFFRTRNPEHVMRGIRSLVFRAEPDARELGLNRAVAFEILRTIERERARAFAAGLAAGRGESAAEHAAARLDPSEAAPR
ncbi:tRNA (cytidine/uridine-2'-O-)-methyltransferase TrmJ [Gemmatimonadetes bacterium T265]|nr:tRNA (cytidine/uridine-2'-O-)-methyltransferase TrmJ [Gemmatimonadetes bacterium T265]